MRSIKKSKPKAEEHRSLPCCHEIFSVLCNEEAAIQFCFDKGAFNVPEKCPKCDEGNMKHRQGRKHNTVLRKIAENEHLFAEGYFLIEVKFQLD